MAQLMEDDGSPWVGVVLAAFLAVVATITVVVIITERVSW